MIWKLAKAHDLPTFFWPYCDNIMTYKHLSLWHWRKSLDKIFKSQVAQNFDPNGRYFNPRCAQNGSDINVKAIRRPTTRCVQAISRPFKTIRTVLKTNMNYKNWREAIRSQNFQQLTKDNYLHSHELNNWTLFGLHWKNLKLSA